jgi:ribosome maturation factor RimP
MKRARMSNKEQVLAVITPAIESLGFYIEDITITSAGKRSMLTVIVDGDTHLSLDQVTVATKAISEIVENLPTLGNNPFTLEVTSPGLDRPLTKPRHWSKNQDRLIKIILNDGKEVTGRIKDSTESSVTVDEQVINFADIKRATLEIEFKKESK